MSEDLAPASAAADRGAGPGSTATLRTHNEHRVIDALRDRAAGAAFTQAELARATGLAPATVSNIVRKLAEVGLVDSEPGRGRRGRAVRLARAAGLVAGVDFGHRHVAVALGDLTGRILTTCRSRLEGGAGHEVALAQVEDLLTAVLAEVDATRDDIRNVVVGLPAPVVAGVAQSSSILPGWVGVDAGIVVSRRLGLATRIDNDANLGALAEHRVGAATGHDTSVFIKVASGVGAGIIIENKLFHGAQGTAGELGHVTLDESGPVCRCGSRGCLETYAASGAVEAMLAHALPGAGVEEIVEHAVAGNQPAIRALEDAGLHLGWGIASVVNIVNPGVVVIGGDLATAGDLLIAPARRAMRRHALGTASGTPVLAGALGERASLVGAVLLAAEETAVSVS